MSDAQEPVEATLDYGERGTVRVYRDGDALARAAAQTFAAAVIHPARARAFVALSGGSTPGKMGHLLAQPPYRDEIPWRSIEVFWGDERWVPEESPESNAGEAMRALLNQVDVEPSRINPVPTQVQDPQVAARMYATQIKTVFGDVTGMPAFDLIFLGMGDDGHTASLFPGTTAIHDTEHLVIAHHVPKLNATRVTFGPALINAARQVAFLVGGAGKAETLARVLDGPIDVDTLSSQVVRPTRGQLVWLVDAAAATGLAKMPRR